MRIFLQLYSIILLSACTSSTISVDTYPGSTDDSTTDAIVCPDESEITLASDYIPEDWGISIADAAQTVIGDFTGMVDFMEQTYPVRLSSKTDFADLSIQTLPFDINEDGVLECQYIVKMNSSFSLQVDGLVSVVSDEYPRLTILQLSSGAILSDVDDSVPYNHFNGTEIYNPKYGYYNITFNNDQNVTYVDMVHLRIAYEDLRMTLCRGEKGCP